MDNVILDIRRFNLIEQGTVTGLDSIGVTVQTSSSGREIRIKWSQVKGIPLSEDVLVANGFKKVQMDGAYHYELKIGNGCKIVTNDTLYNEGRNEWCIGIQSDINGGVFNNMELNCIHHLQNLYFDLKRKPLS